MVLPAFNGISCVILFQFSLTFLHFVNFPWLKMKLPDPSLTLKNFFSPDHFLTCGNNVKCEYSFSESDQKTETTVKPPHVATLLQSPSCFNGQELTVHWFRHFTLVEAMACSLYCQLTLPQGRRPGCIPQDFHAEDLPRLFKFDAKIVTLLLTFNGLAMSKNTSGTQRTKQPSHTSLCSNNPNFLPIMFTGKLWTQTDCARYPLLARIYSIQYGIKWGIKRN